MARRKKQTGSSRRRGFNKVLQRRKFKLKWSKSSKILAGVVAVLICGQLAVWGHSIWRSVHQADVSQITNAAHRKFVKQILPTAQAEQRKTGVLTSITLAQAILESNWGQSTLASKYHNLFGIKGTGKQSVLLQTQEYTNNTWTTIKGRFAVYPSYAASIKAHTKLFTEGTTWNKDHYKKVLTASDYRTAAQELQNAGYATDPTYAQKLIKLIKKYHLAKYDKVK